MNSNYKILHIISSSDLGGAQTLLKEIINHSQNQYVYNLRKSRIDNFKELGGVFYYNSYKYYKFNPLILLNLYQIVKKYDFKVLHAHSGKPSLYGCLLKLLNPNLKLISHEHGEIFLDGFLYAILLRLFQRQIDLFIAVSKATKQKLIEKAGIPRDKIKVLYNFVDLTKFCPEMLRKYAGNQKKEKLAIDKNDFVIGFIGRLSKVKRCECLIGAVPFVNIQKLKVVIAGDGPERKNLEGLSKKLGVEDKVIFLGYVKALEIYCLIDCLVIPSKFEASPMIFYESQALGIPIVASNVSALNELIKNYYNGLLFKPGSEKDLAEKIGLIYNDKKLREKLRKNSLKNIQNYPLNGYLKKIKDIYKIVGYEA